MYFPRSVVSHFVCATAHTSVYTVEVEGGRKDVKICFRCAVRPSAYNLYCTC